MSQHKATVVGWLGRIRTTGFKKLTMAEFLDAYVHNNSERDDELQVSSPDIIFVVRFSGSTLDGSVDSNLAPPSDYTSSDIICPVFVQVKLYKELSESKAVDAHSTVQPTKFRNHRVDMSQYCQPDGHYISLIVSYPAGIARYLMNMLAMGETCQKPDRGCSDDQ
ncbi:hypothetical protein BG015_008689 [Linnemannia schmuckeri]|uniref:Uncharacterized protein n=1 Tax=Linnemannia schmuckeri TaxID=64567 RepID=A0A9P5S8D5_9FUNG|nr:hypothetical protein BG015_008689 [Linnemannia schmuckeri]